MISSQSFLLSVVFSIITSFTVFYFLKIKNLLIDQTFSSKHKQLTGNNLSNRAILAGGIIIFLNCLFFFDNQLVLLKILSALIVIIGTLSDMNKLNSPKIRIFFQFLIVLFLLLFYQNFLITDLRIDLLNDVLKYQIASVLFTIFCILILMNGTNFLDGINTLVIGYYILVLGTIIVTSSKFDLYINYNIFYLLSILIIVFLFNLFNKVYLGDSGSYLIAFLTAFFILDFVSKNNLVSPYFFCLLLWYPAFENLFSILRRILFRKKLDEADQGHLHQIIFKFLKDKNFFQEKYLNSTTGILINFFNFLIFIVSYKYYLYTEYLALFILLNIFVYLFLYFFIKKKINHS